MPIESDVILGRGVKIFQPDLVNIYGCRIGDNTRIGAFVEVQKNVFIGANCKISSHTFVCEGVRIGDGVFVGHSVVFINDRWPAALNERNELKGSEDWILEETIVDDRVSIGSGSVIMCGVSIGQGSIVGANSFVNKNLPPNSLCFGNPARVIRRLKP